MTAEQTLSTDTSSESASRFPAWSPVMTALVICAAVVAGALLALQEPPPAPPDPNRYVGDGYAIRIPPAYEMDRNADNDYWLSSDGDRALRVLGLAVHDAPNQEAALHRAADEMVNALHGLGLTFSDEPAPINLPAGPARLLELTVNDNQRLTAVALADQPRAWIFILMAFEPDIEQATLESIELDPAGEE